MTNILLLLSLCLFSSFFVTSQNSVVELTDETFNSTVGDDKWIIFFYAPWCGYCKEIEPKWQQLPSRLSSRLSVPFRVGKIDATAHKEVAARYDVDSFPTLKFVWGEVVKDYRGDRDIISFVNYCAKMSKETAHEVKKSVELSSIRNDPDSVLFLLHLPSGFKKKSPELQSFRLASRWFAGREKIYFYYSFEEQVATDLQLPSRSLPFLVSLCGDSEIFFEGDLFDKEEVHQWIQKHQFPPVPELSSDTFELIVNNGKSLFLLVSNPSYSRFPKLKKEITELAIENTNQNLSFCWINIDQYQNYLSKFGINKETKSAAFVLNHPAFQYYPIIKDIKSKSEMAKYLSEVSSGKIKVEYFIGFFEYYAWMAKSYVKDNMTLLIGIVVVVVVLQVSAVMYFLWSELKTKTD